MHAFSLIFRGTLKTNDPQNPICNVVLKGVIYNPINVVVSPTECILGEVIAGQKINKSVLIRDPIQESQMPIVIESISNTCEQINATISNSWKESKVGRYTVLEKNVNITIDAGPHLGPVESLIQLTTNRGEIVIPVSFVVVSEIEVYPRICILSKTVNTKRLQVKSRREVEFVINEVACDESWYSAKMSRSSAIANEFYIDVAINDKLKDKIKGHIKLSGLIEGHEWETIVSVIYLKE